MVVKKSPVILGTFNKIMSLQCARTLGGGDQHSGFAQSCGPMVAQNGNLQH
jgi:hypothetical protein